LYESVLSICLALIRYKSSPMYKTKSVANT
jgi:hypothetical protein